MVQTFCEPSVCFESDHIIYSFLSSSSCLFSGLRSSLLRSERKVCAGTNLYRRYVCFSPTSEGSATLSQSKHWSGDRRVCRTCSAGPAMCTLLWDYGILGFLKKDLYVKVTRYQNGQVRSCKTWEWVERYDTNLHSKQCAISIELSCTHDQSSQTFQPYFTSRMTGKDELPVTQMENSWRVQVHDGSF